VQLQGFFVLFTSLVDLSFVSDNTSEVEVDGLPIFGKVGVVKFVSFFTEMVSSINSSLIVTLEGVETYIFYQHNISGKSE